MKIIFAKTNFAKKKQFLLETGLVENKDELMVFKKTTEKNSPAKEHLSVISILSEKIAISLRAKNIKTPKLVKHDDEKLFLEYIPQPTLAQLIENCFYDGQPELSNEYIQIFKQAVEEMDYQNKVKKFPKKLTLITDATQIFNQFSLNKLVDLSLDNLLFDQRKKQIYLLDQEWIATEALPAAYIYHQTILNLAHIQRNFIWRLISPKFPVLEVSRGVFIPKSWLEILELTTNDLGQAHQLYRQFHQQTQNLVITPEIEFYEEPKTLTQPIEVNFLSQYEEEFGGQFQKFDDGWPKFRLPDQNMELKANLEQAQSDLTKIQSARVYKIWQKIASYRKKLNNEKKG